MVALGGNPAEGAARTGKGPAPAKAGWLLPFMLALFFTWGLATVLVDIITPKLKSLFSLSYAEATLTQFCFFLAYAVISLPAGALVARIGYIRGLVLGLLIMAAGACYSRPPRRSASIPCSWPRFSSWPPASRCCRSRPTLW